MPGHGVVKTDGGQQGIPPLGMAWQSPTHMDSCPHSPFAHPGQVPF